MINRNLLPQSCRSCSSARGRLRVHNSASPMSAVRQMADVQTCDQGARRGPWAACQHRHFGALNPSSVRSVQAPTPVFKCRQAPRELQGDWWWSDLCHQPWALCGLESHPLVLLHHRRVTGNRVGCRRRSRRRRLLYVVVSNHVSVALSDSLDAYPHVFRLVHTCDLSVISGLASTLAEEVATARSAPCAARPREHRLAQDLSRAPVPRAAHGPATPGACGSCPDHQRLHDCSDEGDRSESGRP